MLGRAMPVATTAAIESAKAKTGALPTSIAAEIQKAAEHAIETADRLLGQAFESFAKAVDAKLGEVVATITPTEAVANAKDANAK